MNSPDRTPRSLTPDRLSSALHEAGGTARPDYLSDIVAQAGRTRQRPAWTLPERWNPMDTAIRSRGVPRAALTFALLALLLVLLAATVVLIGSRPPMPLVVGNGLIAFSSGGDIVVAEPDGSGRRILIEGARSTEGWMAWSPRGDRLAYWSAALDGTYELIVVDALGEDPVTVASGVVEPTMARPSWSPDGTAIAYSARTETVASPECRSYGDGAFCGSRIFVAAADGSGVRQIGDPALDARSPDFSPDGSKIAFGGGSASPQIGVHLYVMDSDGSNVEQLSDVVGSGWAFIHVDWSHDGTKIVGQAGATGDMNEWDIWVIPIDGSAPTNVGAHDGGDELLPVWAPGRDALAWNYDNALVVLEEGAEPLDIAVPSTLLPVWSPDGRYIALTTADGVVVIDVRGRTVTTIEGPAGAIAWQPLVE
jgi:Tol biopolymer transport system component